MQKSNHVKKALVLQDFLKYGYRSLGSRERVDFGLRAVKSCCGWSVSQFDQLNFAAEKSLFWPKKWEAKRSASRPTKSGNDKIVHPQLLYRLAA